MKLVVAEVTRLANAKPNLVTSVATTDARERKKRRRRNLRRRPSA